MLCISLDLAAIPNHGALPIVSSWAINLPKTKAQAA